MNENKIFIQTPVEVNRHGAVARPEKYTPASSLAAAIRIFFVYRDKDVSIELLLSLHQRILERQGSSAKASRAR
jgi:hypothetical protein